MNSVQTASRPKTASLLGQAYGELADYLFARQTALNGEMIAIGVTSIQAGAGTTTIAQNMAIASAEAGQHTLLIAERPPNGESHDGKMTLIDAAKPDAEWAEALTPTSHGELFCALYAEPTHADQELDHEAFAATLTLRFDRIIIDLPVIQSLDDHHLLTSLVGGVIVVAEPGAVDREQAMAARDALQSLRIRNLGLVLNKC